MLKRKTISNIIIVTISNVSTIFSGILASFLLPKIMPIDSYGYYKTFTLYITYIGLFSLGIIDGIVLTYGGNNYKDLDRPLFRSFFKWYTLVHVFFCVMLLIISAFMTNADSKFIIIVLAVYLIANNLTGYFQQISQITQRFKEYSARKIIQSFFNILIVFALYKYYRRGNEVNYRIYTILFVAVSIFLLVWYLITYKEIVFGYSTPLVKTKGSICKLIESGFPLLFANLCSTLILSLDRQFVNVLFNKNDYAIYAFAYNMLSLVTVATSAISTVLFPTLKRTNIDTLEEKFSSYISIMLIFVYGAIIVFFPLCAFIKWFLPQYMGSLVIFRIIFPGLAITSVITVIMHNYYKVCGDNIIFFKKSIMVLFLSGIANLMAYLIFRTTEAISIASIIAVIIWYFVVNEYFVKKYGYNHLRNTIYILIMLIAFYFVSAIKNEWIGMISYIGIFVATFIVMFWHDRKELLMMELR